MQFIRMWQHKLREKKEVGPEMEGGQSGSDIRLGPTWRALAPCRAQLRDSLLLAVKEGACTFAGCSSCSGWSEEGATSQAVRLSESLCLEGSGGSR